MRRRLTIRIHITCLVAALAVLAAVGASAAEPEPGKPVLYRDEWGVPHVYGANLNDASYALGYAQAEDRLDDIFKNIRTATGYMAEAFGPEYVEQDYALRMVKNAETCEKYWETAPDFVREPCDRFMDGVRAYMAEHPEKKPDFAVELHGWQCAAVGRTMILQWPLGTLMDDLHNKGEAPAFGSNAFCVAPSRSAEGCPILMTDPHLTWEGLAVFYEMRMHTPEQQYSGFAIVGTPLTALGHNANVAWACTTGGPDTSDVYMVKLNPRNVVQYQYEGKWETFKPELFVIDVKGEDRPRLMPALYTLYGPLVALPDEEKGIAYAGCSPYFDQAGVFEQMFSMANAGDCDEFYKALGMNQFMEQNLLFADRKGNIQYVRSGRTPIRPEGDYNWSAPIPGGTEATRWLGIHSIDDLVQIKNPPQGYFQNCNVSPESMMVGSPMTPDKYKDYIFNVSWDRTSPRGERLRQLLDADDSITIEEALDYTLDIYDLLSKPWQDALRAAAGVETAPADATVAEAAAKHMADPDFAEAVKTLLEWDGRYTRETTAGAMAKFWRLKCEHEIDIKAIAEGRPLGAEDQVKMLEFLAMTLVEFKSTYGTIQVKWGDINLIGRGDQYFPCPAADFGGGPGKANQSETVMDVSVKPLEGQPGKYVAYNGSSAIMVAFMRPEGVESYSLINWGVSGDPNSPHYMDQGEKLYANRKFKPTWFKKEDLLQHVESEKVLTVP